MNGGNIALETAQVVLANEQIKVEKHVAETGTNGDLSLLLDATNLVVQEKEKVDPKAAANQRLQTANTNLRSADDAATRHNAQTGTNGDLTALLNATVKARQAREAISK